MKNERMDGLKRTAACGELRLSDAGKSIVVGGFVQKTRELGNLTFIDLRDRSGIVQLNISPNSGQELLEKASACRAEFVVLAKGTVAERQSKNTEIPTGEIEIMVEELRILSRAATPPFEILDRINVKDELRLRYRYLDLRRPELQNLMMLRHRITKAARDYFDRNGFLEIETPTLIKATPEGARDYLVPSRVHPGAFYALPQSPQQYKQLLMLSGYERYMQIARCYRDEDLRADRQPEFTQIDLEMAFVDEEDVMQVNEGFVAEVFQKVLGVSLQTPFPRLPYTEAMSRYGSDKPDIRFQLELVDLSDLLRSCEFKVFAGALAGGGSVRGIIAKNAAASLTRKEIDRLTEQAKTYHAKGLAYTRLTEEGETSSFEKFLTDSEKSAIRERLNAVTGDVILIVADPDDELCCTALGAVRLAVGERLGLIDHEKFALLWVTEFPQFEYSQEEDRFVAKHHPFTAPVPEDEGILLTDKKNVRARAYDLVLNGCELGGGSIRINDPDLQATMFEALGFSKEEAQARFGFFLEAFRYGAPPHGGMAYGLDRLVMLMAGRDSLRDVIAFPKVQNASELMSGCPTTVDAHQLEELSVAIVEKEEA